MVVIDRALKDASVRRFANRLVARVPYPPQECPDRCRPVVIPAAPEPSSGETTAIVVFVSAILLPLLGWVRLRFR